MTERIYFHPIANLRRSKSLSYKYTRTFRRQNLYKWQGLHRLRSVRVPWRCKLINQRMWQHQAQRWPLLYKILTQIRQKPIQHSIFRTSNLKGHRVASHGTVFHQSLCSCVSILMTLWFVNNNSTALLNYNRASRLANSTQQIQETLSEAMMTTT